MTRILNLEDISAMLKLSNGKYITYITILFLFTKLHAQTEFGNNKLRTVVIDPGHGGRDPGAIGRVSKEKEITLSISQKLGKLINQRFPEVKVIYTRNDDQFVELYQRAEIANKAKADLFISIHANSTTKQSPSGVEFWVLGLHKADENLEVVKKENAALQFEQDIRKNYGFDPNSPEGAIILTMKQNLYLDHSIQLAKLMESRFVKEDNQLNRGSKQAGFIVLYKTSMPSVLVEVGFISNPDEEQYIANETGQNKIAANLANAFADYKTKYESGAIKAVSKENPTSISKPEMDITKQPENKGFSGISSTENTRVTEEDNRPVAEIVTKTKPETAANAKPNSSQLEPSDAKKKIIIASDEEIEKYSKSAQPITANETKPTKVDVDTKSLPKPAKTAPNSASLNPSPTSKVIVPEDQVVDGKKIPELTSTPIAEKFEKKTEKNSNTAKTKTPSKEVVKQEIMENALKKSDDNTKKSLPVQNGRIKLDENEGKIPSYMADANVKKEIVDNTKKINKQNDILEENTISKVSESNEKSKQTNKSIESASHITNNKIEDKTDIIYRIQVKAASAKIKNDDPIRATYSDVEESFENGLFKYLVGNYSNETEAKSGLMKVRNQGVKDAFIVKYKDGVRIK